MTENPLYVKVFRKMSYDDLLNHINHEILSEKIDRPRTIIVVTLIVERFSRYHKVDPTVLADLTAALLISVFKRAADKDPESGPLTATSIGKILRSEYSSIMRGVSSTADLETYHWKVEEGRDFADEYLAPMSPLKQARQIEVVRNQAKMLPGRLSNLFSIYVDTGVLLDDFLTDPDRLLIHLAILNLGVDLVIDTKKIESIIPETGAGRAIFFGILADRYPKAFSVFALTESFQKLIIFCNVHGGEDPEIPDVDELIKLLDTAALAVESCREGKFNTELKGLAEQVSFDVTKDNIPESLVRQFEQFMELEQVSWSSALERLSRKAALSSRNTKELFERLQAEMMLQVNFFKLLRTLR